MTFCFLGELIFSILGICSIIGVDMETFIILCKKLHSSERNFRTLKV